MSELESATVELQVDLAAERQRREIDAELLRLHARQAAQLVNFPNLAAPQVEPACPRPIPTGSTEGAAIESFCEADTKEQKGTAESPQRPLPTAAGSPPVFKTDYERINVFPRGRWT